MRAETAKPAKVLLDTSDEVPRAALEALGEVAVEVLAISEIPDALEPSTKPEPHCDCKADAKSEDWLGKSWFIIL